jgi:hypothetical protein
MSKGIGIAECPQHGEYHMDAEDSPCPSCEDAEVLDFAMVTSSIVDTMAELEGEQIAEIHNQICSRKINYVEDSIWEYSGEKD